MEKNDIFNTNLLQLPLKAQVADEEVVQNIAPVAEPTAPAMRDIELSLRMNATTGPSSQPSTSIHTIHLMPSYRRRKTIP